MRNEAFDVVVVGNVDLDTNVYLPGAGDGLVLDGYSLEDSIRRDQIAARHTCSQKATSSNLITTEQMTTYFDN
jgi:hypothetical protein